MPLCLVVGNGTEMILRTVWRWSFLLILKSCLFVLKTLMTFNAIHSMHPGQVLGEAHRVLQKDRDARLIVVEPFRRWWGRGQDPTSWQHLTLMLSSSDLLRPWNIGAPEMRLSFLENMLRLFSCLNCKWKDAEEPENQLLKALERWACEIIWTRKDTRATGKTLQIIAVI